jgi:hypothetical protein
VATALLALGSLDAVAEIPPLGDDYEMLSHGPGEFARAYLRDFGWGRPIGIGILDLLNTVRAMSGLPLVGVILAMRVAVLGAVYITLRRLYAFPQGLALLSVALIAWNPAASESWVLLSSLHLAVSVVPLLISCGLYARALGAVPQHLVPDVDPAPEPRDRRRWLLGAAAAQTVVNFTYEQGLLAIPAFVAVLSILPRPASLWRSSRLTVLGVAGAVALVCGLTMVMTGYVSSRSTATTAPAAELSDFVSALDVLWMGFAQHHLWRIVEVFRTKRAAWWDSSSLGFVAAMSTLVAAAFVTSQLLRDRRRFATPLNAPLALASFAAAYACLLPQGLAYPGYTVVSRLYYLPGAFVALAVAALMPLVGRVPRYALGVAAGGVLLWLGTVTRRYYEDMRLGSRMVRAVARSVAQMPSPLRRQGLLVIAPNNVGTFSTSAVEYWSLRPAVRELTGINPEGPLFFVTDCEELRREQPVIHAEGREPLRWAAVLRYRSSGVQTARGSDAACEGAISGTPAPPRMGGV